MHKVTDLKFICLYTDNLETTKAFYEKWFNFQQTDDYGDNGIFGTMGDVNMWMGFGYEKQEANTQATRATFMLGIESSVELHKNLKEGGVQLIHEEANQMGENLFWFQFVDPAGNIIDVLGGG